MSDLALRVSGLGKRYRIGTRAAPAASLRERITDLAQRPLRRLAPGGLADARLIWALEDVSFEVRRGEVLGIIGGNGAGKSTLLKILSRITEPTTGEAVIHGRVGSLIEVGTGFHQDLTGRENIYLNGAILGMRKHEIDRRLDRIIDFSEVGPFIDTPVRHYSSGMYIRLGFAVAAQMEPEVLIVDEVLAVGDVHFQRKCLGSLDDLARSGRTVLFVSHNMAAIQRLCTSAILLDHGHVVHAGDVEGTVAAYLAGEARGGYRAERTGGTQILAADLEDEAGRPLPVPRCTEPLVCRMRYVLARPSPGVFAEAVVLAADGVTVFSTSNRDAGVPLPAEAGEYDATLTIPANVLLAGDFHIGLTLRDSAEVQDQREPALSFSVETGPSALYLERGRRGSVHVPCAWAVRRAGEAGSGG